MILAQIHVEELQSDTFPITLPVPYNVLRFNVIKHADLPRSFDRGYHLRTGKARFNAEK